MDKLTRVARLERCGSRGWRRRIIVGLELNSHTVTNWSLVVTIYAVATSKVADAYCTTWKCEFRFSRMNSNEEWGWNFFCEVCKVIWKSILGRMLWQKTLAISTSIVILTVLLSYLPQKIIITEFTFFRPYHSSSKQFCRPFIICLFIIRWSAFDSRSCLSLNMCSSVKRCSQTCTSLTRSTVLLTNKESNRVDSRQYKPVRSKSPCRKVFGVSLLSWPDA